MPGKIPSKTGFYYQNGTILWKFPKLSQHLNMSARSVRKNSIFIGKLKEFMQKIKDFSDKTE